MWLAVRASDSVSEMTACVRPLPHTGESAQQGLRRTQQKQAQGPPRGGTQEGRSSHAHATFGGVVHNLRRAALRSHKSPINQREGVTGHTAAWKHAARQKRSIETIFQEVNAALRVDFSGTVRRATLHQEPDANALTGPRA